MATEEKTFPYDIKLLQQKIGYTFKDEENLLQALKHSSYIHELRVKNVHQQSNERLEFFGDSVLSFCVCEYLFMNYPEEPEGELTRKRAELVCTDALSAYAEKLSLGDYLYLGKGEEPHGRRKKKILENAFEALLGAIYIDGGIENVKNFLYPLIKSDVIAIEKGSISRDHKSRLQQIVQTEPGEVLEYVIVNETGPQHDKTFECEVRLNGNVLGRGESKSKRGAEQRAAEEALAWFGENRNDKK